MVNLSILYVFFKPYLQMAWGNEVMSLRKNCIHKHSAQNGDFLNFALGHFDLPNQL